MMRKICALLLCLVLMAGLMAPTARAEETEEELLEVALKVQSNLKNDLEVKGLYRDNVFYITPRTVCALTGGKIHAEGDDYITFSLHEGLRHITVYSTGRFTEVVTLGRAYSFSADIPVVMYNGQIYMSATRILRYMGAVVGFGENEMSGTHMTVSMPYTVFDLIVDYSDVNGYQFSWSEAQGKWVDPEDMVALAALDTILLGYDSNILAYAAPGHADKVQKEYYSDVLMEILRTEGKELLGDGYTSVDLFGDASDVWSFSAAWIGEVTGWIEDSDFSKNLSKSMSGALNASGVMVSAGGDYLDSLNAAMQFANMSSSQKKLLDDTLNKISEFNTYHQQLPLLFEAAEEVSALIGNKYAANEKAAWDGIYSVMINAGTTMMNSVNPFALAWDSLTSIAKISPLTASLLDAEKAITFTAECQNIAIIARSLVSEDCKDLYTHNFYMFTEDTEVQELLKSDMLLELKASLTARTLMLSTGWLTEVAQNTMQRTAEKTAELLNKAENAQAIPLGILDKREEDITWIANLVGSGAMGNVVRSGGNVYYWQYSDDSFYEYSYNCFSYVSAANKLMCMDKKGNCKVVMELNSHGEFAIVNNSLIFYRSDAGKICSVTLDGKTTKVWGEGYLKGVTEDGAYLYYEDSSGKLMAISAREQTQINIGTFLDYVTYYNGRLYAIYHLENDHTRAGQVTLFSMAPDGSDSINICTTEELYEFYSGFSYADVAQMRFTEDYLYFSYGSCAGTGYFFQGGKVIRAKYDGSEAVVVAGQNELVGAQFSVNADGTVSMDDEPYSEVYFTYMRTYGVSNGTVYQFNERGYRIAAAVSGDYPELGSGLAGVYNEETESIIQVAFAEIIDGKSYYLLHLAVPNPEWMSWRETYVREKTVMYCKDLETGKVTVLYQT